MSGSKDLHGFGTVFGLTRGINMSELWPGEEWHKLTWQQRLPISWWFFDEIRGLGTKEEWYITLEQFVPDSVERYEGSKRRSHRI